jgi:hypothetical protein
VAAFLPSISGDLCAYEVPSELVALGPDIAAQNRSAVLADRASWHAVLPIKDAARLVDQPWAEARLVAGVGQPSTMLRPEFGVVGYLFRDDALDRLREWCDAPEALSVRHIDAVGGTGKTRFAVEACRMQEARGWVAGMLPVTNDGLVDLPLPRLIVVDYVEERDAETLVAILTAFGRHASALAPVRLLLLSRPAAATIAGQSLDPLREAAAGATLAALDAAEVDTSTAVEKLTGIQRRTLFEAGMAAFGRTWYGPVWQAPKVSVQLSDPRYGRPLDVLLEAFDAALSWPNWRPDHRAPVDRALDHEIRRWKARLSDVDPSLLRNCAAVATLVGARTDIEAQAALRLVPDLADLALRQRVDRWLCEIYPGPDRWNPMRPDRLGEALIIQVLTSQPDGGLTLLERVLDLPFDTQVQRALDVLIRLSTYRAASEVVIAAFASRYVRLAERVLDESCKRGAGQ